MPFYFHGLFFYNIWLLFYTIYDLPMLMNSHAISRSFCVHLSLWFGCMLPIPKEMLTFSMAKFFLGGTFSALTLWVRSFWFQGKHLKAVWHRMKGRLKNHPQHERILPFLFRLSLRQLRLSSVAHVLYRSGLVMVLPSQGTRRLFTMALSLVNLLVSWQR